MAGKAHQDFTRCQVSSSCHDPCKSFSIERLTTKPKFSGSQLANVHRRQYLILRAMGTKLWDICGTDWITDHLHTSCPQRKP